MKAAEAYDALIALQKSGIPKRYHKRTMERLSFEDGSPSIEDQVKALHEEFWDIRKTAMAEEDLAESNNDSQGVSDSELEGFLDEEFGTESAESK